MKETEQGGDVMSWSWSFCLLPENNPGGKYANTKDWGKFANAFHTLVALFTHT